MTDEQRAWITGVRDRLDGALIDLNAILEHEAGERQAREAYQENMRRENCRRRTLVDRREDYSLRVNPEDEGDGA